MDYEDEIKILFARLGQSNKDLFWHVFELTSVCWTRMLFEQRPLNRSSEDEVNQLEEFTRVHAARLPWVQQLTYAEKSTMLRLCVILCRLEDNARVYKLLFDFEAIISNTPEQPAPLVLRASISSAIDFDPKINAQIVVLPPPVPRVVVEVAPVLLQQQEEPPIVVPVIVDVQHNELHVAKETTSNDANKRHGETVESDDDDGQSVPTKRRRTNNNKHLLNSDSNCVVLHEPPLVAEFIRINKKSNKKSN